MRKDAFPFPLVLTPFEHYMLADDSDVWPMTVSLRIRFAGSVQPNRLEQAVTRALVYHPLLRARVEGDIQGPTSNLQWVSHEVPPPLIWRENDRSERMGRRFDLQRESGLRIYVSLRSKTPCLVVQWHHACCDGMGILSFVKSLLHAYRDGDLASEGEGLELKRDLEWWRNRGSHEFGYLQTLRQSPHHLSRIVRFFRDRAVRLAVEEAPEGLPADHVGTETFCWHALNQEETSRLIQQAKRLGVTVNDLVIGRFYSCLLQWNARHGAESPKHEIRIAIPTNLRRLTAEREPAINNVSMVFLDRGVQAIRSGDGLLNSVSREMQHVKTWHTGWAMIYVLKMAGMVRHGMNRVVAAGGPSITAVLSNPGRVFTDCALADETGKLVADSFVVEAVELYPPVRQGVHVAVGVLTYAKRLTISLNYDRTKISAEAAKGLLEIFVTNLQDSATTSRS